jgi:hypothetical protein
VHLGRPAAQAGQRAEPGDRLLVAPARQFRDRQGLAGDRLGERAGGGDLGARQAGRGERGLRQRQQPGRGERTGQRGQPLPDRRGGGVADHLAGDRAQQARKSGRPRARRRRAGLAQNAAKARLAGGQPGERIGVHAAIGRGLLACVKRRRWAARCRSG